MLVCLFGQAEQHLGGPVDRGAGAVHHRGHVRRGPGRGLTDEPDHRVIRVAVIPHADHDAVAEPVDQLPA